MKNKKNSMKKKYKEILLLLLLNRFVIAIPIIFMFFNIFEPGILIAIIITFIYIPFIISKINKIYEGEKLINCVKLSSFLITFFIIIDILYFIFIFAGRDVSYDMICAFDFIYKMINLSFLVLLNMIFLGRSYKKDKKLSYLLLGIFIQLIPELFFVYLLI